MNHDEQEGKKYLGLTPTQLNGSFVAVVLAVALAAFIYFDGPGAVEEIVSDKEQPTNAGTVDTDTASTMTPAEVATSAVLTLDDLPSGWTVELPDEDEGDDEFDYEFSPECALFAMDDHPDELASVDSDGFTGPDGQELSSDASVFTSGDVADGALQEYISATELCRDELVSAFQTAFAEGVQESGGDIESVEIAMSFEEIPFPELGQSSVAYRLVGEGTTEGVSFQFIIDSIIVRSGRMVGGVTYTTFAQPDLQEEQFLAEILAGRLEGADAIAQVRLQE